MGPPGHAIACLPEKPAPYFGERVRGFWETSQARLLLRIILSCSSLQDNSWAVLNYTYLFQYASTSTFGFENFCIQALPLPERTHPG